MAIAPVELKRQDKSTATPGKQGGGQFGTMAGLAGGAVLGGVVAASGGTAAAPIAASTIAQGAMAGGATGSGLGGLLGEKVKPTKEGSTAIDRRIQAGAPAPVNASDKLRDSIMALHQAPPEVRQQYAQPLVQSYLASLAQERKGGAV